MSVRVVPALLRREKLLVRLVVAFLVLSTLFGAGLLYVSSQALTTRDATARAATRRIDLLNTQIGDLRTQLRAADVLAASDRAAGAEVRAELLTKIDALAAQVRQLGGKPVVTATATTTATAAPTPATTAAPGPTSTSSTTSTTQKPTTSSTTACRVVVGGVCVP